MNNFKIGDMVQHKSGGPKMVIESFFGANIFNNGFVIAEVGNQIQEQQPIRATCSWFNVVGAYMSVYLSTAALKLIEE